MSVHVSDIPCALHDEDDEGLTSATTSQVTTTAHSPHDNYGLPSTSMTTMADTNTTSTTVMAAATAAPPPPLSTNVDSLQTHQHDADGAITPM